MRKLASIQRVVAIGPIEGADVIVRAQVQGWNLVTQKSNNFQPGDLVIYHEIDSLLPIGPEYDFMAKGGITTSADGSQGYRLRTIKLKGQISQGLILPISLLAHKLPEDLRLTEGLDISEYLGVKKYEAPIPAELAGSAKGMFPGQLIKTDEERVQNLIEQLQLLKGKKAVKTIKIDGASQTNYVFNAGQADEDYGVCTRSVDLLENPDNSLWKVANRLDIHNKLREIARYVGIKNIAIQGEIYGEGIQGNKLKKVGQHFAAFNLFNADTRQYFDYDVFLTVCSQFEIPTVPIIDENYIVHDDIEQYLREADELKYENGAQAEGMVIVVKDDVSSYGRTSFKVISNKFLLKTGE